MWVLDIGSGNSTFPIYMAGKGCTVYASDVDNIVFGLEDISRKAGFGKLIDVGSLKIEHQDSRNLSYPDNYFDRVSAISTLEHIPDTGDISSIKEICRVLKSGGRAFISVEANAKFVDFFTKHRFYFGYPYFSEYTDCVNNQGQLFAKNYDEFKKNKKLYSLGFVRYYNKEAILTRIINSSGLILEDMGYYASRYFSYRMFFDNFSLSRFIAITTPLIARLSFKKLGPDEELDNLNTFPEYLSNAIAYLILTKR
jgi:ubiquinone/menaquinone biosynthesis C-methylase UbiE